MQLLFALLKLVILKKLSHKLDVTVAVAWYCDRRHAKQKAFHGYLKAAWEFSVGRGVVGGKVQSILTKEVYISIL